MKCFLDMDGILVNFVKGACDFHGLGDVYAREDHQGQWDFDKRSGVADFWSGLDFKFWANLDWMHDGRDILAAVEAKYGPDNVYLLTAGAYHGASSIDAYSGCLAGKMVWIEKHLPPRYLRQHFIGAVKEGIAHDRAILIDDHDRNIERFEAAGGKVLLVPRRWNKRHLEHERALEIVQQH